MIEVWAPAPLLLIGWVLVGAPSPAGAQVETDPRPLGVGVVQPPLDPAAPLYFYGSPTPGTLPDAATPIDSVTFAAGDHYIGIEYAPPWFAPTGMKLDYDLLWLYAETLTRNWIEVEVNAVEPRPRMTPRTVWIAREAVAFHPWPEFLLRVYSIETLDPERNPVRGSPDDDGERLPGFEPQPLLPITIRGEWVEVETLHESEAERRTGWLRWSLNGRIAISFALLN